jgi:hypothetical protein
MQAPAFVRLLLRSPTGTTHLKFPKHSCWQHSPHTWHRHHLNPHLTDRLRELTNCRISRPTTIDFGQANLGRRVSLKSQAFATPNFHLLCRVEHAGDEHDRIDEQARLDACLVEFVVAVLPHELLSHSMTSKLCVLCFDFDVEHQASYKHS